MGKRGVLRQLWKLGPCERLSVQREHDDVTQWRKVAAGREGLPSMGVMRTMSLLPSSATMFGQLVLTTCVQTFRYCTACAPVSNTSVWPSSDHHTVRRCPCTMGLIRFTAGPMRPGGLSHSEASTCRQDGLPFLSQPQVSLQCNAPHETHCLFSALGSKFRQGRVVGASRHSRARPLAAACGAAVANAAAGPCRARR